MHFAKASLMRLPAIALFAAFGSHAEPSVTTSIVQRAAPQPGITTVAVRLHASDLALGAYQGILRFAPGSLQIISATTPRGDGVRFSNMADSSKGVVQFSGFTTSGFDTTDVLVLVVRPLQKLETASLTAELSVATDLQGKAVPGDRLIPARGLTTEVARP